MSLTLSLTDYLAGFVCQSSGILRPSEQEFLDPDIRLSMASCPAAFNLYIHPNKCFEKPYYEILAEVIVDPVAAEHSI
jgi:hypothetical protein